MTIVYVIAAIWIATGALIGIAFSIEDGPCLTLKQRVTLFLTVALLWPVFFFSREDS